MSVVDKFLNYMKLNDEEEDAEYYDNDYLDDDEPEPAPQPKRSNVTKFTKDVSDEEPAPQPKKQPAKTVPMRQNVSRRSANGMQVCVIKPTTMEDAREITETLLGNRAVILNLEGLGYEIAQRIIDFTSGSCFAISGNLQKISEGIFIITPASMEIRGDVQDYFGDSINNLSN